MALRHVLEFVLVDIHAAGRDLVQQRLPDVRPRFVDERDRRLAFLAQLVAERRGEFQTAGTAADHNDMRQFGLGDDKGARSVHEAISRSQAGALYV